MRKAGFNGWGKARGTGLASALMWQQKPSVQLLLLPLRINREVQVLLYLSFSTQHNVLSLPFPPLMLPDLISNKKHIFYNVSFWMILLIRILAKRKKMVFFVCVLCLFVLPSINSWTHLVCVLYQTNGKLAYSPLSPFIWHLRDKMEAGLNSQVGWKCQDLMVRFAELVNIISAHQTLLNILSL